MNTDKAIQPTETFSQSLLRKIADPLKIGSKADTASADRPNRG